MFEVIIPADPLLLPYIQYIYRFTSDDRQFNRRLVIFPNTGSAITFYKDVTFIETGYQHFRSFESESGMNMVLHLNRTEPITIHESGRQKRVGVVLGPLGINQFITHTPGELKETNNPSLIPVDYFDSSFKEFCKTVDIDQSLSLTANLIEELLIKNYRDFTNAILERCIRELSNPDQSVKLESLAQKTGASTKTINRLFHKYIGLSPVEFRKITQFRNALNTKLKDKDASFSSIALENNYYDLPYMIKIFKEFTGINAKKFFDSVSLSAEGKYVYLG